jgi:hypothetical protein
VKSDKKIANGVIWNNDIVKSDKNVANGVIWNNDIVKSDKKIANGVIWNNDILVKSGPKDTQGVIWHKVTEVTHALTAEGESGLSDTSPQAKETSVCRVIFPWPLAAWALCPACVVFGWDLWKSA